MSPASKPAGPYDQRRLIAAAARGRLVTREGGRAWRINGTAGAGRGIGTGVAGKTPVSAATVAAMTAAGLLVLDGDRYLPGPAAPTTDTDMEGSVR